MSKSLLVFFFLSCVTIVHAQAPFNGLYGSPWDDMPVAVAQTADGGYAMAGNTSWNSIGTYDFNIIKTDASGDTLWTGQYGTAGEDRLYDMKTTSDGGYVLVGSNWVQSTGNIDVYVVRIDSTGQLLWSSLYTHVGQEFPSGVIETSSGDILVCGTTDSMPVQGRDCGFLLKLNASGQVQWMNRYRLTPFSEWYGREVIESDSGGYIFAGYGSLFLAAPLTAIVVRTDTAGNLVWTKAIDDASVTLWTTEVLEADSGRIVLAGTSGAGVFVLQLNGAGAFLQRDYYSSPLYYLDAFDIALTAPYELIITGKSYNGSMIGGMCMKVSLGAPAVVYANDVDQTHEHYFVSCQVAPDGGIVLLGPYPNAHAAGDSASHFLVKTDVQGNAQCESYNLLMITGTSGTSNVQQVNPNVLTGVSQFPATTYLESGVVPLPLCSNGVLDTEETDMQVYPNPTYGDILISISHPTEHSSGAIEILNPLGEVVLSMQISGATTVPITLPDAAGIYLVRVITDEGISVRKIIRE